MVNTVLGPRTQNPSGSGIVPSSTAACPRCYAGLFKTYDEPQCFQCGYVDYEYTAPKASERSLLSSATRFVLRYKGDFDRLEGTLTDIELKRVSNRTVLGVTCPFCTLPMNQSPPSGGRRPASEKRYRCERGHRVSLIEDDAGAVGWK